jgi:hypothetical protein
VQRQANGTTTEDSDMRTIACLGVAVALLMPADAEAQRRGNSYRYNSYSFSPYVGAFMDAYDLEADGSNTGWVAGFRAGYTESSRLDLHLNLGYAQTGDAGPHPAVGDFAIVDNQWVLLTAGGAFALVPGNTSISLGGDLGVGWLRTRFADPADVVERQRWSAHDVIAPALILRHQFTPRVGIHGSVQDYIFDLLDGSAQHSPAFTAGLTIR